MRTSSVIILTAASAGALGAAWILSGAGQPGEVDVPVTAPTVPPPAEPTAGSTTAAPVIVLVDGALIETKYGNVQVQVVIDNQVITDVIALTLTDSSETSVEVSNRAAPILREEVLASQSAAVAIVSGATYTSEAYLTSLQSALDAAGFAG